MSQKRVGQFEIVELLGEGGIGQVFTARDTVLDRLVAIKSLRAELTNDKSFVERFRAEAKNLALLSHPNITTLYTLLEQDGTLYMVMELVRGRTLETILSERGAPFTVQEALAVIAQAADGLAYAHEMGIVHRDIKPANLILTNTGLLKIMDFGIARAQGQQRMTRDGSIVGTLAYMSPEQCRGQDVDGRTDQYSLAIVLYEMLTGKVPFSAATDYDLMQQHINTPPEWPSRLVQGIAPHAEKALMCALSKKATDRFATLGEFKEALGAPPNRTEAVSIVHKVTRLASAAAVPASLPTIAAAVSNVTDSVKKSSIPFALKGVAIGGGLALVLALALLYVLAPASPPTVAQQTVPAATKVSAPPPQGGTQTSNPYFVDPNRLSATPQPPDKGVAPAANPARGQSGAPPFALAAEPNRPGTAAPSQTASPRVAAAPTTPSAPSQDRPAAGADANAGAAQTQPRPNRADDDATPTPPANPASNDEAARPAQVARVAPDGGAKSETAKSEAAKSEAAKSDKDAIMAYEAKSYASARELAEPCAKDGNPECQFILARVLENGLAGAKDPGMAAEWYRKAAEQGLAKARYNLGAMYYEGNGVPKDVSTAALWFSKAASQNHPLAQFNLAGLYASGEGVTRNLAEARRWYTEVADKATDKELAQDARDALQELGNEQEPRRRRRRHR